MNLFKISIEKKLDSGIRQNDETVVNKDVPKHNQRTILLSMGTRPEIIKMSPIYLELKKRGAKVVLLHTGQHNELAKNLYELFEIKPDYNIELSRDSAFVNKFANNDNSIENSTVIYKNNQPARDLAMLSSKLLAECSQILSQINPHLVLVHGDTSSALMMAMAAYYHRCKIVHVEAGLRSHNEYHPFPEEKNRVLIGKLAHIHFAPTARARANLLAEGISDNIIHLVGNTIVNAAQIGTELFEKQRQNQNKNNENSDYDFTLIDKLSNDHKDKKIVLITTHRRENHESGIKSIAESVVELLKSHQDMVIVWPLHPNPIIADIVSEILNNLPYELSSRLILTPALPYPILLWILKQSWLVLTDSGGIQEEAVALKTPVLVLRKTTERQELIESGAGFLVGTSKEKIIAVIKSLSENESQYQAMRNAENPFGDNYVVHRICNILLGVDQND